MKGIVKILEAIIASIILITTISFFITVERTTRWDTALFQTKMQDTLSSLDRSGNLELYVKNYDKEGFENLIKNTTGRTTDFSISIDGIPDSEIVIACNCTNSEITDLKTILNITTNNYFFYKTRRINITINQVNITEINNEDILFVFGYKNLSQYKSQITNFLNRDHTIFMFSSLSSSQINDTIMNDTFGLKWNNGLSDSNFGDFYPTQPLPENMSYKTSKYHYALSETTGSFGSFTPSRIEVDERTIVRSGSGISHLKINDKVTSLGKGRAIWFASYNYPAKSVASNNTDILMKASILFASERFNFDPVPKAAGQRRFEYTYIATIDNDPYSITMIAWRVFF